MPAPAGVKQQRFSAKIDIGDRAGVDRSFVCVYDDGLQICDGIEWNLRDIGCIGKTMRWSIEIGAGIRDHVDPSDLKLGPRGISRSGGFAAEKIGNGRSGETGVSDHSVFDRMAQIDQHRPE